MSDYILLQIVWLPILAGGGIMAVSSEKSRHALWITMTALAYTSVLLVWAFLQVSGKGPLFEPYGIGPRIRLDLMADGISLPIALVVNLICLALACYSSAYVQHRIHHIYPRADVKETAVYMKRFYALYLFFPTGFMGVAFSSNLMALYFFMELLTIIPLYFIMAQFGYSDIIPRFRVAMICLFWGVAGATLFLVGILVGYAQIHSFAISELAQLSGTPAARWVIILILSGLFTKLAILPFHAWMPLVHAEHPTCIAGLLAVYANIAIYIAFRVLIHPLWPDMEIFALPVMTLAAATMVYGALLTLAQTDIKRFCACSTISQISYSVFGVFAMTLLGIKGGVFYFLSHILGKAVLFSTAGMLVYKNGTREMGQMGGLAKKMPVTAFLWFLAALILSALPLTSGFVGKWLFFAGAFQAAADRPLALILVTGAVISTLLTLVYTFRAGFRLFLGPLNTNGRQVCDPPWSMRLPILFLALVSLVLGLWPAPVLELFDQVLS